MKGSRMSQTSLQKRGRVQGMLTGGSGAGRTAGQAALLLLSGMAARFSCTLTGSGMCGVCRTAGWASCMGQKTAARVSLSLAY